LTLLERLRQQPADDVAWQRFVERYGPKLEGWCRHWGLQPADAQDVAQSVLTALWKQMANFEYRPSGRFRSWLKTVAYRAWCAFREDHHKRGRGSGDSAVCQLLESTPARDDLLRQLQEECDRELLELAVESVRGRVQEHTWEAYRLMALEELPAEEVASRLQMKAGAVYVAKSKVIKMLREEIERLEAT
jgi:RNA polymerase sigma-70 factor (ECF subfamily)